MLHGGARCGRVVHGVAGCCSVWQCVAVYPNHPSHNSTVSSCEVKFLIFFQRFSAIVFFNTKFSSELTIENFCLDDVKLTRIFACRQVRNSQTLPSQSVDIGC